ncbi:LAG1-DNAbind-domain-containing [Pyrrhoderma noxium]|uniref:LAG1-DNAbind-domain-containing n=1 Tax=Pyrrhoderma noxium TaxID=2282107 RepID=A0A286UGX0_9AGAM|nr:LAG1-DNAbind-domain-containing [Pyrrhoderma noxium]
MSGSAAAIWSALPHHQPNDRQLHMDHRSPAPYVSNPFDFSDLLNNRSDKRNSLSYSPSNNQQAQMHTQQHSAHPPFAPVSDFDRALAVSGAHSAHPFDHTDNMDISSEHASNYDYFPPSNGVPPFARYNRTNASSSSSLGQPYPPSLSSDSLYPHPQAPFGDSLSSFSSGNSGSFDLVNGLSSSYSSGKVSPLTPNDSVIGLQSTSGFPGLSNGVGKDGFPSSYNDLIGDRRTSNVSTGSFQSDYHDEFGLHRPPIDMMRGVNPHATHGSLSGFEDFNSIAPGTDLALRMPGQSIGVDETLSRMKLQPHVSMNATDLQSFIRPYLDQYIRCTNRLAFGERTVIVMSSKVAQKSYGTEKRFLCPPPTAIMIGNSWWSETTRRGEEPKQAPPRVVISISGEPMPQEGSVEWTSTSGKAFDVNDPPSGTTYIGRCVGKQLYISDVDEKKKKVEALVKIMAPASDEEPERVIGVFPSRPIKVISKPSKKRQSAKNLELCINHGSTISLFHRLRSQTVSTKYLCVSGSGASFKGSDGAPLMGVDQRTRTATPSFIARTASWDPFVMYIVDVNKPAGGIDAPPPPPPQPDYPSPPPNAIPFTNNGSQIPIFYNQTVVLQCLTSGVVSPVLIIRKVDHGTTVVGGGLQEGAKGVADLFCAPGEVCGDPVSQLHKIAFEVYDANKGIPEPGTPGLTGAFLSCMGEKVNTYRPVDGRIWNAPPIASSRGSSSPGQPSSPVIGTPASAGSNGTADYFVGPGPSSATSAPASPSSYDFPSNDGGRVKRGKRSTSSTGGGVTKTHSTKGRRRASAGSTTSSSRHGSNGEQVASSGALWQVDIGETSVWTIVGTDQVRYNFYVPPVLFDQQISSVTGSYPIPSKPITPFPGVVKYLPPDRAAEAPKNNCPQARAALAKPNPHASKMLTLYGENFNKADPVTVFFGSDPSPYVEVRCAEVVGCLPPESQSTKRRPIILVRPDGVVFPSNTMYP